MYREKERIDLMQSKYTEKNHSNTYTHGLSATHHFMHVKSIVKYQIFDNFFAG